MKPFTNKIDETKSVKFFYKIEFSGVFAEF